MKWILSLCAVLSIVLTTVVSKPPGSGSNSNAVMACQQTGGICVKKGECPSGFLATAPTGMPTSTTLCDEEQDCCFSLSDSVKPCQDRGGECTLVSACGKGPVDVKGQCMTPGMVCCVRVEAAAK